MNKKFFAIIEQISMKNTVNTQIFNSLLVKGCDLEVGKSIGQGLHVCISYIQGTRHKTKLLYRAELALFLVLEPK